nr:uncharacterized protein LOC113692526 [Coffea arabica]XP_027066843.1 uncharacterized protein LOC113692526 [Coffea arabica]
MAFAFALCLRWPKSKISIGPERFQEFPECWSSNWFLVLRVHHGRCFFRASSNTIKSKLPVSKHIAVVSRDCQACLLAAIISSAVMMAMKLILQPILVDIAHLFM